MTAAKRAAALAPRPALPVPASTRPRLKRLNVDVVETDHRALKAWAVEAGVEVSQLVRAMLELTRTSNRWRTEVEALAGLLAEGGRGARP